MRLIALLIFVCAVARAQAVGSSYYHWSDDGHTIYATSTVEASMHIINPPGGAVHTYTAALTLKGPKGNTSSGGPIQISESITGTSWPVASAEISMGDIGTYYLETDDTAYCSVLAALFFSDLGQTISMVPPPSINSNPSGVVDNTTQSNYLAVDTAGYMAIYGESLLCEDTCNQAEIQVYENDDPNVTIQAISFASDQQIDVGYTIGAGAKTGNHCLYVQTPIGVSNCGSYVIGDATPSITSITPSTFVAGSSTPNVQIAGQNFGTNCPKFAITPTLAGTYFTAGTCTDTLVTGTMNIDANAAAGQDTVTLTGEGFNGQPFAPQKPGEPQSTTKNFNVTLPPPPPTYTVTVRAFIRGDYISAPPLPICAVIYGAWFAGDNRNFMANPPQESPSSNPYRMMQTVTVQPESSASQSGGPFSQSASTGTTREYDEGSLIAGHDAAGSGLIINSAISDTVVSCNGGAHLIGKDNAAPPTTPGVPSRTNPHAISAVFQGAVGNPLEPTLGTVLISWNITVTIDHTNPNNVKVSATGSHTCYPGFEVWVTSSANPSAPYYVWEYGPGGATPNVGYDESLSYLTGCLSGLTAGITVNGTTYLPK